MGRYSILALLSSSICSHLYWCHVTECEFVSLPVIKFNFVEIIVQCDGPEDDHEQEENCQKSNLQ